MQSVEHRLLRYLHAAHLLEMEAELELDSDMDFFVGFDGDLKAI